MQTPYSHTVVNDAGEHSVRMRDYLCFARVGSHERVDLVIGHHDRLDHIGGLPRSFAPSDLRSTSTAFLTTARISARP